MSRDDFPIPKVEGVLVGIVTNIQDPDSKARVKLNIPIFGADSETDWARVATLMGGNTMGSLFIPDVGDEVLVAFEAGDPEAPYVIGSLWSDKNKPPAGGDYENNTMRKIRSRSGHELIFNDDDNGAKVTLATSKGQIIDFDTQADSVTVSSKDNANQIVIKGGTDNSITLTCSQTTIKINQTGEITLSSNNSVSIKSTQINIEAQAQMNIKAQAALNLEGQASLSIKSSGMVQIQGSMVKIN
ncbi:phage baseplate assembly protein V [Brevibacillus dissolubilis]|uniref:phage baseplate assembly protein V n=1 Tax=Brevibacillus dissolubilis TaxID=1844116 RepID=UPI0011170C4A|nr:phage baseplate assembly protein V [Brevibacillus dissolubilis]